MMFTTHIAKSFSYLLIVLHAQSVFLLNAKAIRDGQAISSSHFTMNTNKQNFSVSAIPTDTEVQDLVKSHIKATSPMAVLPRSQKNVEDTNKDFIIDEISAGERTLKMNGRFNTTSGAVAAVTCLSLAVVAYIGLILWKKVLQKKYEAREILLNDDDFGDMNDEDMRHFEAACIEIQA